MFILLRAGVCSITTMLDLTVYKYEAFAIYGTLSYNIMCIKAAYVGWSVKHINLVTYELNCDYW